MENKTAENLRYALEQLNECIDNPRAFGFNAILKECWNTISNSVDEIEAASLQCAEMKETIKTLRGLNEALCEDLRNKNEQCAEMKKELAGLKDVIGVYENLVIATQTYLQSISGRDIVHDQEAFNKVDAISNELNEKYKALNLVPHDTINKP